MSNSFRLFVTSSLFCFLGLPLGYSKTPDLIKHPYAILTANYGIITKEDLAYDASHVEIGKYDPKTSLSALYWQCFKKGEVTAKFDSWRGPDSGEAWNKIFTMCTIEIDVRHGGELQIYADHRAHQVGYCREFLRDWKKNTWREQYICLNGEGGFFQTSKVDGTYKLWTFEKYKTKKGCDSYFSGACKMRPLTATEALH